MHNCQAHEGSLRRCEHSGRHQAAASAASGNANTSATLVPQAEGHAGRIHDPAALVQLEASGGRRVAPAPHHLVDVAVARPRPAPGLMSVDGRPRMPDQVPTNGRLGGPQLGDARCAPPAPSALVSTTAREVLVGGRYRHRRRWPVPLSSARGWGIGPPRRHDQATVDHAGARHGGSAPRRCTSCPAPRRSPSRLADPARPRGNGAAPRSAPRRRRCVRACRGARTVAGQAHASPMMTEPHSSSARTASRARVPSASRLTW